MTQYEFLMYSLAYQVKVQGELFLSAQQAWLNQSVKATKKVGKGTKSAYKNFNEFYNYEKEFNSIFKGASKRKEKLSIADRNRLLNQKGG